MMIRVVSIAVALGFTILMAGANLAYLTAQAQGNPVPLLGFEIPQVAIMAMVAICVDTAIVVGLLWLDHHARNRAWMQFAAVLVLWLFCCGVSVYSLHEWLSAANVKADAAMAKDKKKSNDLKVNIAYERKRLEGIRQKLIEGPSTEERKALKAQEEDAKKAIDNYQAQDWQLATTVDDATYNKYVPLGQALGVWFAVVTIWYGFRSSQPSHPIPNEMRWDEMRSHIPNGMRNGMGWDPNLGWDEKSFVDQRIPPSQNGMDSIPPIPSHPKAHPRSSQVGNGMESGRPKPVAALPPGVLDARPRIAEKMGRKRLPEDEAIATALAMRAQNPPAPWSEIAEATGWPVSSINRKCSKVSKG